MEDVSSVIRPRSRSKTPFLRSSCDRDNCSEGADHLHHKTGRKTPIKRSTPVKQIISTAGKVTPEPIVEESEDVSAPAHRTRNAVRNATEQHIKTSDYSSEESLDRIAANTRTEKHKLYEYERVSRGVESAGASLADFSLSPIQHGDPSYHLHTRSHNASRDKSSRLSPAYSACSTDSSFAEQALADASLLLERDPQHARDHLPYRLYRMAGEYWNKYPKTDYTYSPLSRDRVELAPGQVAVPNMSRRSLSQFRIQGPLVAPSEWDQLDHHHHLQQRRKWSPENALSKRYASVDSSEDEGTYNGRPYRTAQEQRWWITRLLITIITTITTTTSSVYHSLLGPPHRYQYAGRQQSQGILSRTTSYLSAPFYWIYSVFRSMVTTTVTTITETVTPNHVDKRISFSGVTGAEHGRTTAHGQKGRRWWPWLLLLLLPIFAYGSYYTYENYDHLAMPNFTDFHLDLSEFSAVKLPQLYLPTLSMPNITMPRITNILPEMPEINITLPDLSDSLPEVAKTYNEYRDIVENRVSDASEYVRIVAESCYEELSRFWHGIIG